jgi:uncharacterized flavoprotein (TIGR03862 family)
MKKQVAIVGGGASALMLAAQLDETKYQVTIYERNAALGRKFLVAGDGGFNLTHSEALEKFVKRYTPDTFISPYVHQFTNTNLIDFLKSIGIDTFIGTSKRVFPVKGIKPIDVLNAFMALLHKKQIIIKTNHTWRGWKDDALLFDTKSETLTVIPDITVFALGGSSWKVTGSDGLWTSYFSEKGISIKPFLPSNCAFKVDWNSEFIKLAEGKQLKNIALQCGAKQQKGELVITQFGLEGGALYALSTEIRAQLHEEQKALIVLDIKPQLNVEDIKTRLRGKGNRSITKALNEQLNLNDTAIELLKAILTKEQFTNINLLAEYIKQLPITISATAPIDEAISTVGGIALYEINTSFQLKKLPNHYVIGEMLDWDAPTGGYLLQACFSMGYCLAKELNKI